MIPFPWLLAATVVHVGKAATGTFAVVDIGENEGLEQGDLICFYEKEADEPFACEPIATVRTTAVGVPLKGATAAKVVKGMRAEAKHVEKPVELGEDDEDPAPKAAGTPPPPPPAPPPASGDDDEDASPDLTDAKERRKGVTLGYVIGIMQPAIYRGVGFNPDGRDNASKVTWAKREDVDASTYGFALAYHAPLWPGFEVMPRIVYQEMDDVRAETVMTSGGIKTTVSAMTKGKLWGFGADGLMTVLEGDAWAWLAGGGLQFMNSNMTMKATFTASNGQSGTMADLNSYLYFLAFDGLTTFEYTFFDAITAEASVQLQVPAVTIADGYSGSVDFSKGEFGDADFRLTTLSKSAKHQTSVPGVQAAIGVGYRF